MPRTQIYINREAKTLYGVWPLGDAVTGHKGITHGGLTAFALDEMCGMVREARSQLHVIHCACWRARCADSALIFTKTLTLCADTKCTFVNCSCRLLCQAYVQFVYPERGLGMTVRAKRSVFAT